MPTDFDCNSYLASRCGRLGRVQRHKILYEIYRNGLIRNGVPPFSGTVMAWPLGPVFLDVWKQPNARGFPSLLTSSDCLLAEEALQHLGSLSGKALAKRSHEKHLEWAYTRLGLKPAETGNRHIVPEITLKLAACDRLAIDGDRVKVFRPDDSVEELNRGVKQLAALYALGAKFAEVLIQTR